MHRPAVFFCVLCLSSFAAHATDPFVWGESDKFAGFENDFEADTKTWKEIGAQLPAYPKEGDLIPITVSATAANRFFVDYPSVSASADGVVRYTMLIKSPSGAATVSYEGLRCTTGERKLYAFGHAGGEWSRNRYAKWEPIQARAQNDFRRELFYHYFCTVEGAANLPRIQYFLKTGGKYGQD